MENVAWGSLGTIFQKKRREYVSVCVRVRVPGSCDIKYIYLQTMETTIAKPFHVVTILRFFYGKNATLARGGAFAIEPGRGGGG